MLMRRALASPFMSAFSCASCSSYCTQDDMQISPCVFAPDQEILKTLRCQACVFTHQRVSGIPVFYADKDAVVALTCVCKRFIWASMRQHRGQGPSSAARSGELSSCAGWPGGSACSSCNCKGALEPAPAAVAGWDALPACCAWLAISSVPWLDAGVVPPDESAAS